jgi:hypothetical protein
MMPAEHGTVSGYNRHLNHGEVACSDCLAAERMRMRRRGLRRGLRRDLGRCKDCGSVFEPHRCGGA